jgi:DNA-binding response OmpR family regulator
VARPYPAEILIVEGDEAIMGALAHNLSRSGFGVSRATNGAYALRLAGMPRTDLILVNLPDIRYSVLRATPLASPLLVRARIGSRCP